MQFLLVFLDLANGMLYSKAEAFPYFSGIWIRNIPANCWHTRISPHKKEHPIQV